MSEARWCDAGGHAFSVNGDDWETYSGTRNYRDDEGNKRTEQVNRDVCGVCVRRGNLAPAIASGTDVTGVTENFAD